MLNVRMPIRVWLKPKWEALAGFDLISSHDSDGWPLHTDRHTNCSCNNGFSWSGLIWPSDLFVCECIHILIKDVAWILDSDYFKLSDTSEIEQTCNLMPLLFLDWKLRSGFRLFINMYIVDLIVKHVGALHWNYTLKHCRIFFPFLDDFPHDSHYR